MLLASRPVRAQVLWRPPRGRAEKRPLLVVLVSSGRGGGRAPVGGKAKVDEDGLILVREEDVGRLERSTKGARRGEEGSASVCSTSETKRGTDLDVVVADVMGVKEADAVDQATEVGPRTVLGRRKAIVRPLATRGRRGGLAADSPL